MRHRVVLVTVAGLTACAGFLRPTDTLTHVPEPVESRELSPLEPELRALYRKWFPDREVLILYPAERGWRPHRHADTGVLMWREAELVIGYREGAQCTYTIYRAIQESLGASWASLDLGYPQGLNGDRELRKNVDCATMPAEAPAPRAKTASRRH